LNSWSITGTRNTIKFLEIGKQILEDGGAAIDAVEAVIKRVESNPEDWSVGYNGFPNLLGTIELDASIMLGSTRMAGCVAGIQKFEHPISIARKVMEQTPHVLLIGEGAERFAKAIGFEEAETLSDESAKQYYANIMEGKDLIDGMEVPQNIRELAWRYDKYVKTQLEQFDLRGWYTRLSEDYHGTVNVIAKDQDGEICCGVSTSGLALKFPGRTGDSAVIGAGNYSDIRFGAAACVGTGELAIRLGLARQTVSYLEKYGNVEQAVKHSIQDLLDLGPKQGVIQVLAMDKDGKISACSNQTLHYIHASSDKPEIRKVDTIVLEPNQ
jgi:beta-aspartyl-peptidase (threonine type)